MSNGARQGEPPGFTSNIQTEECEIRASVEGGNNPIIAFMGNIDSSVTDPGNIPTTTIRGGTILGKKASDGKLYPYDPDATDGTQNPVGILDKAISMMIEGIAEDQYTRIVAGGIVKQSELLNFDQAAGAILERFGFRIVPAGGYFRPPGWNAFDSPTGWETKTTDYSVVVADSGKRFIATAAANFTLPTIANGLKFEFLQTADANLVVTGDGNILAKGNAAADTLTFSTSSEKIGAFVRVEAQYVGATLKWVAKKFCDCTMVVA